MYGLSFKEGFKANWASLPNYHLSPPPPPPPLFLSLPDTSPRATPSPVPFIHFWPSPSQPTLAKRRTHHQLPYYHLSPPPPFLSLPDTSPRATPSPVPFSHFRPSPSQPTLAKRRTHHQLPSNHLSFAGNRLSWTESRSTLSLSSVEAGTAVLRPPQPKQTVESSSPPSKTPGTSHLRH